MRSPRTGSSRRRPLLCGLLLLLISGSAVGPLRAGTEPPPEPDEADLIVTQEADGETVAAGGRLTYTITVANNGPADATEVVVTDTLPANTTLVASQGCVEDPTAQPECGLGTLAAGAMSSFTLTVDVPQDAVGILTNVAEAATATTDPNLGNNDSTLLTGVLLESDLGILISDAPDPVVASGTITYTIEVVNNGPSDASGVQVTDALPEGVVIASSNGCAEDPNASPTCTLGDLAAGDSTTYNLDVRVDPGTVGGLDNTVVVSSLAADPNEANNTAAQTTTAFAEADLDVSLSSDPDTVVAGETMVYTIFVDNDGPSHATNVVANLLLPPELSLVSTSGCAEDPMAFPACSLGDLVTGGTAFYQVTVQVAASTLGPVTAEVFVNSEATDPDNGNNHTDFDSTVISEADLRVSKTDEVVTAVPGESVTYVIGVHNDGPSDAIDIDVVDPFPASLDCIWQCAPEEGASCSGGQVQADLLDTIALPAGLGVTYTAVCQIDSAASGTLANTVRISYPGIDPDLLDNVASDLDTVLAGRADLRLSKSDGITLTAPGQIVTYTVVVSNDGPSDAPGSRVTDSLPDDLDNITWTCTSSLGSSCTGSGVGDLDDTVNLAAGGQLTYLISGTVRAEASGNLVNSAQVSLAEGLTDPNLNNNSDTDFDTEITDQQADLRVAKTDNVVAATPGGSVTYSIVVTNDGPQAVDDARVVDTFAAELSCIWSCQPSAGASCPPGQVAGDIDHLIDLPMGGSATFTAQCAIDAAAVGSLSNTVTVTPPVAVLDPDLIDNSASDLDTVLSGRADLRITKTDNSTLTAPGQTLTYTLQVFNDGPSDVLGARVQDAFSSAIEEVLWTCTATGASTCSAAGSGNIDDSTHLLAGDHFTYVATGVVAADASGTLLNSATVTAPEGVDDPNFNNNTAIDFDTVVTDTLADLSISKTDGVTQATPGGEVTYTLVVSNDGPNAVLGALVEDIFPPEVACIWTCQGTGGAQCAAGQVAGDISQTVDLPVAAVATFVAVCQIDAAAAGTLSNTATVTAPPGAVDPDPLDNSAADLDTVLSGRADLSISKTDNLTITSPGEEITYLITVRNEGPSDVLGAQVSDSFPEQLEDVSWTCTAGGGASCPAGGVDEIAASVDLPAAASLIFQASASVVEGAIGPLQNTATVTLPEGVSDPDLNNNTAIDFDTELSDLRADLTISKTDNTTSAIPGGTVTYTIEVSNGGPAAVTGARVGDIFPNTLSCLWSCAASGGAQCTAGQVAGDIDHLVNLPVGASAIYTALCTIDGDAAGTLGNTATVTAPPEVFDPNLLDNSASDLDTVLQSPQVDLSLQLDDGVEQAVPGQPLTYTLTARNDPSLFALVKLDDALALLRLEPRSGRGELVERWPSSACERLYFDEDGKPHNRCLAPIDTSIDTSAEISAQVPAESPPHDPSEPLWHPLRDETVTWEQAIDKAGSAVDVLVFRRLDAACRADLECALPPLVEHRSPFVMQDNLRSDSMELLDLAFAPLPPGLAGVHVESLFPSVLGCQWRCQANQNSACTAGPVVGDIRDTVNLSSGGQLVYTAVCDLASNAVAVLQTDSLEVQAQIIAPAGVEDSDDSNNSASDSDSLTPRGDLAVSKSDGRSSVAPGEGLTYTIQVVNPGPSDVSGALVSDDLTSLPLHNVFWTCTASVGSVCSAAGVNTLQDTVSLAAGGTLTFLASGVVNGDASGSLVNSVTVTAPEGFVDPIANNNTALDFDTAIAPRADLAIAKSDGVTSAIPGGTLSYVLTVANGGPGDALGAQVRDVFPASLEGITWSCLASPGSTCTASGEGHLLDTVNLLAGGLLTYTAEANIAPGARGTLANTATVSAPFGTVDPNPNDNSASDFDTVLTPRVDLTISKSDGVTIAVPGQSVTYTLMASNAGPSDALAARVDDIFADSLSCLWTCVGSGGGVCTPGQAAGDIQDTVDLPVAANVTYTAICDIDGAARGQLTNTATITAAADSLELRPGDNSASDLDTQLAPQADLGILKSDGRFSATPGEPLTYEITVDNAGPSDVTDVRVVDLLPEALLNPLWTCQADHGASCVTAGAGDLSERVDLPAASSLRFSLSGQIDPGASGTLSNTASLQMPGDVSDPDTSNNSASDDDTVLVPTADLGISKSDGVTVATPGRQITYTLEVVNEGPSDLQGALVTDSLAADLSCRWTCLGSGGALCAAGPTSGDLNDSPDLPVASRATYTAICDIASTASGALANTAYVSVPDGTVDPRLLNNSASDLDTVLLGEADLHISKSDGLTAATPGDAIVYTLVVGNDGPSDVLGAQVSDLLPAGLDCSWSCLADGASTCSAGPIHGNLVDHADLPAGSSVTYSAQCTIDAGAGGTLSNTATVMPPANVVDPNPSDNSATDGDTVLVPSADLRITVSDGVDAAIPGEDLTYTLVVTNDGPNSVQGARVEDLFPDALTCLWGCVGGNGGTCTPGQVSGDLIDTVSLPVTGTATYTAQCQIDPAATGDPDDHTLRNSASVVTPPGVEDGTLANNTASDLDTVLTPQADLAISKNDGLTTATPGESLTYRIVVSNPEGPSAIGDVEVSDQVPAVLSCSWTCVAEGGAQCSAGPRLGDLLDAPFLPPGGRATYDGDCGIDPLATGTLSNTASLQVSGSSSDPDASNNTATDDDTVLVPQVDLSVTLDDGQSSAVPGSDLEYTLTVRNEPPVFALTQPSNGAPELLRLHPNSTDIESLGFLPSSHCQGLSRRPDGLLESLCQDTEGQWRAFVLSGASLAQVPGTTISEPGSQVPGTVPQVPGTTLGNALEASPQVPGTYSKAVPQVPGTYSKAGDGNSGEPVAWVILEVPNVQAARVQSVLPSSLDCTWSCLAAGGASCASDPVPGDLDDSVDIGVGAVLTYTASCRIAPEATGDLILTARVVAPPEVVELDPSNNSDSDVDGLTPTADLQLSKTDGVTTAVPGEGVVYTLVASNPEGPSDLRDATLTDLFPAVLDCLWTCEGSDGGRCTPGQEAGDIADLVDLPVGASATYTAQCLIASHASGVLANHAELTPPAGGIDLVMSNNSASDLDTVLRPQADLSISKTDGVDVATPGGTVTYDIVVRHLAGPSDVVGARVEDTFPEVLDCLWTCAPQGGASCAAGQVNGDLVDLVNLPVGSQIVYQALCQVDPEASGSLSNTATVTPPNGTDDVDLSNNSASDQDTVLIPRADLSVGKDNGTTTVIPGQEVSYDIVVRNDGPSSVSGAVVEDVLPQLLEECRWTCTASVDASCTAGPVLGDVLDTVQLPRGGQVSYDLTCTLADDATGQLLNSATVAVPDGVTDPDGNNNTATDLDDVLLLDADLVLTKSDGVTSATPGGTLTYTLVASNPNGPADLAGVRLTDAPPAALGCSWSCVATPGATCGAQSPGSDLDDLVDLAVGSQVTYSGLCQIDPTARGTLSNTAQLTLPVGASDPDLANNSASDTDTTLLPQANLQLSKSDGLTSAVPGETIVYRIELTNPGPSALFEATVSDVFADSLTCAWSCVTSSGGATCDGVGGDGDLLDSVDLPVGSSLTYDAGCTIDDRASGTLLNTVVVDSEAGIFNARDDDTVLRPTADLSISKSDGVSSAVPGQSVTYSIQVRNDIGPSAIVGATVQDLFPSSLTCTWNCTAEDGASCAEGSQGGDLVDSIELAVGSGVTYTAGCLIASSASGSVSNTATVSLPTAGHDPNPGNNSATDVDSLVRSHDLSLSKSGEPASVYPGGTLTYTLAVFNGGPSDAPSVSLLDILPEDIDFVTATSSGFSTGSSAGLLFGDGFESGGLSAWGADGGAPPAPPEGPCTSSDGSLSCNLGGLGSGRTGTLTLVTRVRPLTPSGEVINQATVSTVGNDPNSSNNTATAITSILLGDTDIGIAMEDDPDPVLAGEDLFYTLTVTNHGPAVATGVTAVDNLPPEVTLVSATPQVGSCGADVGVVTCELDELENGASVEIQLWVLVNGDATSALTNRANVFAQQVDPNPINDVDVEATTVQNPDALAPLLGPTRQRAEEVADAVELEVVEIPTLSTWGLLVLMLGLGCLALRRLRRFRPPQTKS